METKLVEEVAQKIFRTLTSNGITASSWNDLSSKGQET